MDKLNSNNVTALVGPMIGVDSYEVKQDLIDKFEDKRFFHEKEGKFFFDFPSFINHKLEKSGVKKYENMGLDTFKNYKTLASYRYNTLNNIRSDERIYSAIMIKEKP
ncbi:MAG: Multi-copper polyphenol oxidoreductase laccase [Alphaproteobacteria bacterium ADurb.Bin438]|nr:MAG: Multi-copper polyphenol oxidoreductase laccase [Alphaproteobacteria bacterium ADurb.Bin438]